MKFANLEPESEGIAGLRAAIRQWYNQALAAIVHLYEKMFDNLPATRAQIANRLRGLAYQFTLEPSNTSLLKRIEAAAKSHQRFKRCYALDILGRLGPLAKESVATQVEGLLSDDPFVREAAAQALFRLGEFAKPARRELVRVLATHLNEGTARYAVLALGEIGDTSPETLEALQNAAFADNSYAADEAATLYSSLSQIPR
jgi:hypothetical protein